MNDAPRSNTPFRALAESCRDGVLAHDGTRIAYVNRALLDSLGFGCEADLLGRPLELVIYPDDLAALLPREELLTLNTGPTPSVRCVARSGALLCFEVTASACEFAGAPAWMAVLRDITHTLDALDDARRMRDDLETRIEERTAELSATRIRLQRESGVRGRAERALQEREEQLHQALKMEAVGRLAGGIAHDFNNMLSVILSYSHMLQLSVPQGSPMLEPLGEMKRAAERAGELSAQLLAFSRRQVLEPKLVDPSVIVGGLDRMLRRILGDDLQLVVTQQGELPNIRVDPNQLEQVIVNLAINARDAMPDGGQLTIEMATAPGNYVMLAMCDTGSGMDSATLSRIFEPFFTTKDRDKGTGLGLSLVHGIVKQSGGHVAVRSELGQGTRFELYFPALAGASEAPPAAGPRPLPSPGADTVLVVEDSEVVLGVIRTILRQHGCDVLEARSPRAALALAARHAGPIDLLLTDVVMPQMSGPKLAAALAAERPAMRVVYMSGYPDETLQHHGALGGDAPFLQKPFTPESLLATLDQLLQRPATRSAG